MLQLTIVLSTTNDGVNVEPLAIVVDNDAVVEAIVNAGAVGVGDHTWQSGRTILIRAIGQWGIAAVAWSVEVRISVRNLARQGGRPFRQRAVAGKGGRPFG